MLEFVDRGCAPALASRILAPLDDGAGCAEPVAVSEAVGVVGPSAGGRIAMAEVSFSVDGHAADAESRGWIQALSSTGAEREVAVERLHALLVRASRFEVARRRRALGGGPAGDLDDLAMQAAADALVAILRKLHTFRDDSRFTTWA